VEYKEKKTPLVIVISMLPTLVPRGPKSPGTALTGRNELRRVMGGIKSHLRIAGRKRIRKYREGKIRKICCARKLLKGQGSCSDALNYKREAERCGRDRRRLRLSGWKM
jgi:hypothetical protein